MKRTWVRFEAMMKQGSPPRMRGNNSALSMFLFYHITYPNFWTQSALRDVSGECVFLSS